MKNNKTKILSIFAIATFMALLTGQHMRTLQFKV